MKIAKLYTVLAAAAVMLGVASCDTPETPVMNKPTEFKLNTPPFAQQFYALSEGATLEFTCSQPDYGIGTAVHYSMEASLTEDFSANVFPMANINNSASISISATDLNLALCEALGVVDDDTWAAIADKSVMPVYFRAIAQVGEVEWSRIVSNTVALPRVQVYYALKMPAYIYLVGSPSGWTEPNEDNAEHYRNWRLYEADDAIGSNVFSAVFDMPADPTFRFYTALNGWEKDFVGAAGGPNDDKDVDVALTDGVFEGALVATKDKYHFPDFAGGQMTITVDLNKMTVKVQAGAQAVITTKYAYMVGNQTAWKEPSEDNKAVYENWMLICDNAEGLYKASFTLPDDMDDNLYCRFYTTLPGWNGGSALWASVTGKDYPVTPGVAAPAIPGEGCFMLEGAKGETISVVIDSNANTVTFDFVEAAEEI